MARILLLLGALFAPAITWAKSEASADDTVMKAEAVSLAASVLCGEGGSDEYLVFAIGGVIENRAIRWRAGGERWRRVLSVLTEPFQFNARCSEGRITDHHRLVARLLCDGLNFFKPRWFRSNTLHFSDRRSISRCSGILKPGTVIEKVVRKHGKRVTVRQKVKPKRCSPIWNMRDYDGTINGVMFFHRGEQ